ncbi:MAG: 30S ribosomal protein S16 [Clostridiales bacterium]|nr:30S ribosomal protein S16 [Clostridiales bacterium]
MAVKMRLTRMGDKKSPFYRVVVIDSHKARDGQYVDLIGTYNPLNDETHLDVEKAKKWISCGVQPTETVRTLLVRENILEPKKAPKAKQ